MKLGHCMAMVAVLCLMVPAVPSADVEDRIVAVVNNDVVTLSELEEETQFFMKRIESVPPGADQQTIVRETRKAALNQLINELLIEQEARRLGITAADDEVERTVRKILKDRNISLEKFSEGIARDGETLEAYAREVRQYLLRMKIMSQEIKPKIAVAEKEIGEYYRKHLDQYEGKEAVRISQILFILPKGSDDQKKAELKRQAVMVWEKLQAGESFEVMTNRYSQGPAAKSGGDLGFVERNMMFPAVDDAAFRLDVGAFSEVIESPIGFHIIMVTDRRGAGVKPINEVRHEITETIQNEKIEKRFIEWVEELKEKSHIDIRL